MPVQILGTKRIITHIFDNCNPFLKKSQKNRVKNTGDFVRFFVQLAQKPHIWHNKPHKPPIFSTIITPTLFENKVDKSKKMCYTVDIVINLFNSQRKNGEQQCQN